MILPTKTMFYFSFCKNRNSLFREKKKRLELGRAHLRIHSFDIHKV